MTMFSFELRLRSKRTRIHVRTDWSVDGKSHVKSKAARDHSHCACEVHQIPKKIRLFGYGKLPQIPCIQWPEALHNYYLPQILPAGY
jgi:hypothetical protein